MGFSRIKTLSFRNLIDQTVDIEGANIFLTGENGQGKSNFLELIYILCFGSSFRTRQDSLFIKHGASEVTLFGNFSTGYDKNNTISYQLKHKKKQIHLNGKPIHDRKDLLQNIPSIVFTHEDISYINGAPEKRRWFYNQIMSTYDPLFIDTLRKYNKILKLRNAALKDEKSSIIDVLDVQLAEAGREIQQRREYAVHEFNMTFSPLMKEISEINSTVSIKYVPSWELSTSTEDILDTLHKNYKRDSTMGLTTTGPHRDKFEYYSDSYNFEKIASTGQLRLISLIMRITQALFYTKKTSRRPILLLDDVLLELDPRRREKFFTFLPEYEQAFFTFLPGEHIYKNIQKGVKIYTVKEGVIQKNEES